MEKGKRSEDLKEECEDVDGLSGLSIDRLVGLSLGGPVSRLISPWPGAPFHEDA